MSNKCSGYIQYLTPRRKTKTGRTSFQLQLQDSPTSSQNILVFGESQVKMNLFKKDKYYSLIYNEKYMHTSKQ